MYNIDFPVVGIGASAGGLKVLQDFFDHLDGDSDMAFVVITHLAPEKTSAMDELLAQHTSMEVQQIKGKTKIQPNHIYIIPPNKQLFMDGNELLLADKEKGVQAVIDVFFRSLAKECEKLAIGIILSGTGSDGTLGLKAVKEYGGVTMVQDPNEATYSGMPCSAIDTDLVDFVMPVEELAQKVLDHKEILGKVDVPLREEELSKEENAALLKIFSLLASQKGHDFKHYKRSSVLRRLQRRLVVTNNKSIHEYFNYLEETPTEITELFKDLLISVTNFFRDPEAFEVLEEKVIPRLFENKSPEDPIRVWVTGCATGEEVYSLAILLHEYAVSLSYMPRIKIFGTDISEEALRIARRAIYPEAIATDISRKRLQRYFHKEDSGYRVCQEIREKVLISNHDILSDPPFLNQDLISCRNLLIYFNQDLQNEVLKILHYALQPEAYLFLGMADSTIGSTDLFAPIDKSKAIYKARKVTASQRDIPRFPLLPNMHRSPSFGMSKSTDKNDFNFDRVHYSLLAAQYAPASVIIDENNQVMHSSKGVHNYLNYAEGEPTRDLLKMVSSEIQRSLRHIIFRFNQLEEPRLVSKEIRLNEDDEQILLISIQPVDITGFPEGFRQVRFEEIETENAKTLAQKPDENREAEDPELVNQLEDELAQTKEQLQQTIEEYETSNEELMASNEELQSMNEELQTTTEELETSKEELQSVNEELRTVNQELENKIDELKQVNDDLKNLMEATEMGIVFLDKKINVRLYTSSATDIFHFIDSDVGRPLSDVTHDLQYEGLISDIQQMLEEDMPISKQVATEDDSWYIMEMKPYKTTEYNVEGAVITFVDISDWKRAEKRLTSRAGHDEALAVLGRFTLECAEIQPILEKAVTMLSDKLDVEFSALLQVNNKEGTLLIKASTGWSEKSGTKEKIEVEITPNSDVEFALASESPVIIEDFQHDDRFDASGWIREADIVSGINMAVKGSKQRYGLLGVYTSDERYFTDYEVRFVQNTANMVGEAVERIQTELELKEAYKKLEAKIKTEQELQKEILEVEKEERWRLGQYLHDGTAQNLLAIKMLLDIIDPKFKQLDEETQRELDKVKRLVVKSESNIRELSHFILPIETEEKMSEAFQKLVKQVNELYGVECTFDSDNISDSIEDPTAASSLYYITQEAVRNAINHGQADQVNISLSIENDVLQLIIHDNGVGYDQTTAGDGRGINIMKHRADLLGGSLDIKEDPDGGGTLLTCTVPLGRISNGQS